MAYAALEQGGASASDPCGRVRGLYVPGGAGWTPAKASPAAWVDFGADFASSQTTASSAFVQVVDIGGNGATLTAPSSPQRPAIDSTVTLQGRRCAHFTSAADSRLYTATGGVTGRGAHTMYAVASIDTASPSHYAVAIMGQTDAGFAGTAGTIGAQTTQWWGSRSGGSVVLGGTSDTLPHLFCKTYDGTNVTLYIDGAIVAGPTADTGYALAAGFGFAPWNAGFLANYRAWGAVWRAGADSAATRKLHEAYYAKRHGLFLALADGDSMTSGYLVGLSSSWATLVAQPSGLVRVAGYAQPNIAVQGRSLATCLANQPTAVNPHVSASGAIPSLVWIWAGTNDINTADNSAASTYANLGTYVSDCHAVGQKVVVFTIPVASQSDNAGINTWYPTQRAALNTLILANSIGADGVVTAPALDARLQTAGDGTYSITGNSPHYTAAGQAIVAAEAAAILQSLVGPVS